jgi:inorganic pyrophosphatase
MPGLPAVPLDEECALSDRIESVEPMPEARSSRIAHFFQRYKDLDTGKRVQRDEWREKRRKEILLSVERYNDH